MNNDQIRAEFEAYAEQRNWSTRQNNGSYYWADAARAWQVWQAAYQAGRKAEREAIDKQSSPFVQFALELQNKPEGDQ